MVIDSRVPPSPELLAHATELVRSGLLPHADSQAVLAGPGGNNRCALCGHSIGASDVEYEMSPPPSGGASRAYSFHIPCYHAWKQACMAASAQPDHSPAARPHGADGSGSE